MRSRLGSVVGFLAAATLLGGCAGVLQQGLRDAPAEIVGHLSDEGFVPCDAPAGDARWRALFYGPSARQAEYLRTAGLLSLPRAPLVRVVGRVSERHSVSGGYSRTISVTDILGVQLSGECMTADRNFTPIAHFHPASTLPSLP